ncbi:M20/M25/M40 family metallo-hydrolase [uncultured Clostridium sp.]|jgi:tripeptide aminopeptidase|uniref:M20/M25/M40 family metallo-hydrolase n=1 Tax=uncultured Clostridium sp. TaxID=59620 RepID=UPI002628E37A|nr:M20/M25/M40 family metallo-hydrolase [uncultured Clostridium sp.]
MRNKNRLINRFIEYVKIDSESYNEKNFADRLFKDLIELGFEVNYDDAGEKIGSNCKGNIIAKLKGTVEGETVLFSGHMDTVTPGVGIKPIIKDDMICTNGTTILGGDDKAGIAGILEAILTLKENKEDYPSIELVFTVAEEVGLLGSKNLDYSKITAKKAFILDSSGDIGVVTIQGPAQDNLKVKILGKPAHAGVAPETGISAIQIAASAISNMKLLRIDKNTTANIGTINGGKVTNIVCPEVMIEAEARSTVEESLDLQTKHMVDIFTKFVNEAGGQIEIKVTRSYGAFSVNEDNKIIEHMKKACSKVDLPMKLVASGGGSDTNIFNGKGIIAINLASGERKPHTLEEHIFIKDLLNISEIVKAIITTAIY